MCRYCVSVLARDDVDEAEFVMFDKVGKAAVGKPLLTLLKFRNPGLVTIQEIARVPMVDRIAPPEVNQVVGDFKSTSLEAAESANVAAISYLQENNIVVFDDANLQPLKKCRRELLQATSWSWGFEQSTIQLKKHVEAMERDRVQPLTLLLSSDDDSPNTPLLEVY